jgi:hypothetical protein
MTTNRLKHRFEKREIPIKDLLLWDENSRFPDYLLGTNEKELIQSLLQKYALESFANEVVKDCDLPQLERIVVWQKGKRLIVMEGNRRLATYKCLLNPELVEDETIRTKFEILGKKIQLNDNFKFDAIVSKTKKDGLRYVDRKHYHGNNEVDWGQYERDHHIRRTRQDAAGTLTPKEIKSIFRTKIGDMVKDVALPDEMKRAILGKGFITTFYRVVDSHAGMKKLRYEKRETDLQLEDKAEFLALLKIIIFNLINKCRFSGEDLNSRTLNGEEDIKDYLDSISSNDVKEVDRLIALSTKGIKGKRKGKARGQKKKKKSIARSLPFSIPDREEHKFSQPEAINIVNYILSQFSSVVDFLKHKKRHGGKTPLLMKDEYDVQYLSGALLSLFFEVVYSEEWTPSYIGASKRMDLLIKDQKIVIEAKMASKNLKDKALKKQLQDDIFHYQASNDCKILFFLIFDPNKQIGEHTRMKYDLEKTVFESLKTYCIFAY